MLPFVVSGAALALLVGSASRSYCLPGDGGLLQSGLIKGKLMGFQPRATQGQESVQQMTLHLCHNLS